MTDFGIILHVFAYILGMLTKAFDDFNMLFIYLFISVSFISNYFSFHMILQKPFWYADLNFFIIVIGA